MAGLFSSEVQCMKCNGDGTLMCPRCDGEGEVRKDGFLPVVDEGHETCPLCDGSGEVPCDRCGGTGTVDEDEPNEPRLF